MKPRWLAASIGLPKGMMVDPRRRRNEVGQPPFPIVGACWGAGAFGARSQSDAMKILSTAAAILLLSAGLALAQGVGGATAPVGSSTTGPTNPGNPASPGITPMPPGGATVGQAPGADPGNAQDLSNRGNPQDLTKPAPATRRI